MIFDRDSRLSACLLRTALRFMPENQRNWSRAMASEFEAIPQPAARLSFALGCLKAAMIQWGHTRQGLAIIGRALIGSALLAMALFVFVWVNTIDAPGLAKPVSVLCVFYAGAGMTAFWSVRQLQFYAVTGLLMAGLCWFWFSLVDQPSASLPPGLLAALSLEAGMLMAGILVAATYLSFVHPAGNGANDQI